MKNNLFTIGILSAAAVLFTSCKDEKQAQAERSVNNYVTYVDSVGNVSADDAKANWDAIDAGYQTRVSAAETDANDNEALREKLASSKQRYEELKAKYAAEIEAAKEPKVVTPNQAVRDRFFGEGKVGEDMDFSWVNKDNILQVYQNFLDSYEKNKSDFSREDYDEVKLLYEALDARKNTVEKEGLSSEDNNKIASIKFRFAPMFKVNRIGAKARENTEAKDKAE
jgi:thermostable 8-oxoguanine DNA glycosylase